ncbi:MAG: hypothetical protein MHM6MM_002131 [Cercozoa sp. M6MM]
MTDLHVYDFDEDEVPHYLRDNPNIKRGYRANYCFRKCFRSLFTLHNELLNIWSHLLGFACFVTLLIWTLLQTPHLRELRLQLQHLQHAPAASVCVATPEGQCLEQCPHPSFLLYNDDYAYAENERNAVVFDDISEHDLEGMLHGALDRVAVEAFADISSFISHVTQDIEDVMKRTRRKLDLEIARESAEEWLRKRLRALSGSLNSRLGRDSHAVQLCRNSTAGDAAVEGSTVRLHALEQWPVLIFLLSAALCLLFSAAYHTFLSHHKKSVSDLFQRLDYSGIALLIGGSTFPVIYYAFYCDDTLRRAYSTLCFVSCLVGFVVTTSERAMQHKYRTPRSMLFVGMAASGIVPLAHLIYRDGWQPVWMLDVLVMGATYLLGVAFYVTQFPETCAPGRFDYVAASHQLWHAAVLAAALMHYRAVQGIVTWRTERLCV